jgi:diadenosine tetraphosphate (Ap4A) HIT family hydrolase
VSLRLLPESVIEERPSWTLAVNRNQDLLGKTMLVLRRHCTTVIDVGPDEWALLREELRRVVPALDRLFHPDQFNFAFLMNLDAQVHLHVIPRYASSRRWHDRPSPTSTGAKHSATSDGRCPRRSFSCLLTRFAGSLRNPRVRNAG